MNPDRLHHWFLALLSLAAGCIDAIAFIRVGVFPANMTGNTVVLATSLFLPGSDAALLSALALLGFCLGVAGGAWFLRPAPRGWSRRTDFSILAGAVLVLAASLAIYFTGDRWMGFIILSTSAAMGLQSAAVQKLGVAGVATVFMTGTLTAAMSRVVGVALDHPTGESGRWLPAITWGSYFLGAFIGGLHRVLHTDWPLILPATLLLVISVIGLSRRPYLG